MVTAQSRGYHGRTGLWLYVYTRAHLHPAFRDNKRVLEELLLKDNVLFDILSKGDPEKTGQKKACTHLILSCSFKNTWW